MPISQEKVKGIIASLTKLDPTKNTDKFHNVVDSALRYLEYKKIVSQIVAYDRRKEEKSPITNYEALQNLDPNSTIFLREEAYKNNDKAINVITVYQTSARLRSKRTSLWLIRANSNLGIERKITRVENLVEKVQRNVGNYRKNEEKLTYARRVIETTLERTFVVGESGAYYLSINDIISLIKNVKQD